MNEVWKQISGFEGYEVSDLGRVRSSSKILKPNYRGKAYGVTLCSKNSRRQTSIGALVLEAFVGPRPNKMNVCHYPDRDTANNALTNIRWDTQKNNLLDRHAHGTHRHGSKAYQAKITEGCVDRIRDMLRIGVSHRNIAKWFGINCGTVSMIKSGKQWKYHGAI